MNNKARRDEIRRRNRRAKKNKRNMLLLTILMFVLSASILFNGLQLKNKTDVYAAEEQELALMLDEQGERTKEIKALQKYMKSSDYVEEVARGKLGFVYPNEIIFKTAE